MMEHTSTGTSNHPGDVSGFLKLPRELRDMIYDYAWSDTGAIRQRFKGRIYKVSYRRPLWKTARLFYARRGNAQWLLINKQVMYEGLEQLLREGTWYINGNNYPPYRPGPKRSKISKTIEDFLPRLAPSETRVVQLDARDQDNGLQWIYGYNFHRNEFRDYAGHVATILDGNNPASHLETIVLRVYVSPINTRHCSGARHVSFDLSPLKQLSECSKLKKFCVNVKITAFHLFRVDSLSDHITGMQQYMEGLATALSEVGKLIVEGGQETTTDLDEYYEELSESYAQRRKTNKSFWRYTIERP